MNLRKIVVAIALALPTGPVAADDLADLNAAFGKAAVALASTTAHVAACSDLYPDRAVEFRDIRAAWRHRTDMAEAERAIAAVVAADPAMPAQLAEAEAKIAALIRAEVAKDRTLCDRLEAVFEEDLHSPPDAPGQLRRGLRALDIELPDPPLIAYPQMKAEEVVPLALFSARLESVMAMVGSAAGARENRHLREARGELAEAWLKQHERPFLVSGRVIDEDEIRGWQGDRQSTYSLRCRGFETEELEAQFLALADQEVLVVGTIRQVIAQEEGGVVVLDRCGGFPLSAVNYPVARGDATPGLMLRPPSDAEAFAGPGAGIDPADMAHLLYDAEFNVGIDGFGNSYTDRREEIWVLLQDGTAYHHDRSFPFTDLNIELSQRREPDRWFTWTGKGDTFLLTDADGKVTEVEDAQTLRPAAPDLRLEDKYYYLNIGMGGTRTDRSYAFSADGTVIHRRGGFVAGNIGTGYLMVTGPEDEPIRSSYRFDGYAMILDTPEGEVRHFVAFPASADATRPDIMLIGGTAYWLEEEP